MSTPRSKRFRAIRLRDFDGHVFLLERDRCSDRQWFAHRNQVAFVLSLHRSKKDAWKRLDIWRKSSPNGHSLDVGVYFIPTAEGLTLKLGCHGFAPRATVKILRWAGLHV